MKRNLLYILLALPLVCSFTFLSKAEKGKETDKDCFTLYDRINQAYEQYLGDKVYLRFSTQTIQDGEAGKKLFSEMWKDGNKMLLKNPDIEVFHDGDLQVIVYKESKMILIRKADDNATVMSNPLANSFTKDSLIKVSQAITCSDIGSVSGLKIVFKDPYVKKYKVKTVELAFDEAKKELKKGVYETYSKGNITQEIYEYLEFKKVFINRSLEGKALNYIYSSGKTLRNEFQGYSVNDIR